MKKKKDYLYLHSQIKGSYFYLVIAIIFILLGAFFEFLSPRFIGVIIDSVIGTRPFDLPPFIIEFINATGGRTYILEHIYVILILFIVLSILIVSCEKTRLYASHLLGEKIGYNMRQSIFEGLQKSTFAYHKNVQTGDIIQRCSSDIDLVRNFVIEFTHLIRIGAKILIAYSFMFTISIPLASVSFLTIPLVSIFSMIFYPKVEKRFAKADEAEGLLQAHIQENLSAPRVVRAFGKQKGEVESFAKKNQNMATLWIKMGNLLSTYWAGGSTLAVFQEITVICFAIMFASNGNITTGEVISFMVFNSMLAHPINMISRIVGNMSKASVALSRVSEVADCPKEDYDNGVPCVFEKEIEFRNVCFSFEDTIIFKNLSFVIKKGETTAILGSSGSGKTTLLALIARFYAVDSGDIFIDSVNLKDINIISLRKNIGLVMQEPFLFSKTIKENIAFSSETLDMNHVIHCAKLAHIHENILDFTKGYDTIIGERGVTVSGGQKQRIAIARALYTNANILCFDDSLSAVDTITDRIIRANLRKNVIGITQIIISQRINSLMQADNIIVIDDGCVLEQGTHNELCILGGIYSDIVSIQQEVLKKAKEEVGDFNA